MYSEIKGDLIFLTKQGMFDVIAHGCNCYSNMNAGIAVVMEREFNCSKFPMEQMGVSFNKLGCIDFKEFLVYPNKKSAETPVENNFTGKLTYIVNAYTQARFGRTFGPPADYEAIALCMRKINYQFKGMHIGLPKIGAGLAGGDWDKIKQIIQKELIDCKVTVVIYE